MKLLRWRVQSNDDGGFDELAVSSGKKNGCLIHAEMMNNKSIYVSVGDLSVWAYVDKRGKAVVTMIENESEVQPVPNESDAEPK